MSSNARLDFPLSALSIFLSMSLIFSLFRSSNIERRLKTCVPADVTFQEKWRLSLDLLDRVRADLPGDWVVADDE